FEKIDPARPASLSPAIADALLRERLRYEGLAVTDDLEMGAIADAAEGAVLAVAAGADIALICHCEEIQEDALGRLAAAIRSGAISEAAERASRERISAAKTRYIPSFPEAAEALRPGNAAHRALEREIRQRLENIST
ncbi:MAG: beta-N-acetylhexosaminidase, partial [bacterium]|nr:beta-N-acetylhexosaminidase [bacterium]